MKHATVLMDADPALALDPAVAQQPAVERKAIHHAYYLDDGTSVALVEYRGAVDRVSELLADDDGILDHAVSDDGIAYVHLRHDARMLELIRTLRTHRIVIDMPVETLTDGRVRVRLVGSESDLHEAVSALTSLIDLTLERMGQYAPDGTVALTDRQREVLTTAYRLGYYETPRTATQSDVAEALGIAPGTAGEHLRKGEASLVEAAIG